MKLLDFNNQQDQQVRRFQYTAIDDATRIRALKIYERHTQDNAIDFINYVVEKFPFPIARIRSDNVLTQKSSTLFGNTPPNSFNLLALASATAEVKNLRPLARRASRVVDFRLASAQG